MPDLIKGQNRAQQMGSASTYAKRYAFCAALGIVTGDDDDGHAAGASFVTAEQAGEISDLLQACRGLAGFNEPAFWSWVGAKSAGEIQSVQFAGAKGALQKKLSGK